MPVARFCLCACPDVCGSRILLAELPQGLSAVSSPRRLIRARAAIASARSTFTMAFPIAIVIYSAGENSPTPPIHFVLDSIALSNAWANHQSEIGR
jgi:hypothetical protein